MAKHKATGKKPATKPTAPKAKPAPQPVATLKATATPKPAAKPLNTPVNQKSTSTQMVESPITPLSPPRYGPRRKSADHSIDLAGKHESATPAKAPKKNDKLRKRGLRFGRATRTALLDMTPAQIETETALLREAAAAIEVHQRRAGNVTPNHVERVKKFFAKDDIGDEKKWKAGYRAVEDGTDEHLRTASTYAIHQGLRDGVIPSTHAAEMSAFGEALMTLQSLFRAKTEFVRFATEKSSGTLAAHVHPTKPGEMRLPGGAASHSISDRHRNDRAVRAGLKALRQDSTSPARAHMMALHEASETTTNTMWGPARAANVGFNTSSDPDAHEIARNGLKLSVNVLRGHLGLKPMTDEQAGNAMARHPSAGISPLRSPRDDQRKALKKQKTSTSGSV